MPVGQHRRRVAGDMVSHPSAVPGSTVASRRLPPIPVPTALRWGIHLLVAALLVLVVLRGVVGQAPGWPWVVMFAGLVGVVYSVGPQWKAVSRSSRVAGAWLGLLVAAWLAQGSATADSLGATNDLRIRAQARSWDRSWAADCSRGTARSIVDSVMRDAGPETDSPSWPGASGTATATQRTPCSCSSSSTA